MGRRWQCRRRRQIWGPRDSGDRSMVATGPSQAAGGMPLPGPRTRMHVWFMRACAGIVVWTCLVQLFAVGHLWRRPRLPSAPAGGGAGPSSPPGPWNPTRVFIGRVGGDVALPNLSIRTQEPPHAPPPQLPSSKWRSFPSLITFLALPLKKISLFLYSNSIWIWGLIDDLVDLAFFSLF